MYAKKQGKERTYTAVVEPVSSMSFPAVSSLMDLEPSSPNLQMLREKSSIDYSDHHIRIVS